MHDLPETLQEIFNQLTEESLGPVCSFLHQADQRERRFPGHPWVKHWRRIKIREIQCNISSWTAYNCTKEKNPYSGMVSRQAQDSRQCWRSKKYRLSSWGDFIEEIASELRFKLSDGQKLAERRERGWWNLTPQKAGAKPQRGEMLLACSRDKEKRKVLSGELSCCSSAFL